MRKRQLAIIPLLVACITMLVTTVLRIPDSSLRCPVQFCQNTAQRTHHLAAKPYQDPPRGEPDTASHTKTGRNTAERTGRTTQKTPWIPSRLAIRMEGCRQRYPILWRPHRRKSGNTGGCTATVLRWSHLERPLTKMGGHRRSTLRVLKQFPVNHDFLFFTF